MSDRRLSISSRHVMIPLRTRSGSSASVGSLPSSPNLSPSPANTRLRQSIQGLQRQSSLSNVLSGKVASGDVSSSSPLLPTSRSSTPSTPLLDRCLSLPPQQHQSMSDLRDTVSIADSLPSASDNFVTLLSAVDFKQIEMMDPSTRDGSRIVFDREVPVEIRMAEQANSSEAAGTLESIRAKILALEVDDLLRNVRIELTTESDVFFHYTYSITADDYPRMQREQRFMVEYDLLPQVLGKMLVACVDDPETFICVFIVDQTEGCGVLNFLQNLGYKFVELMSLQLDETPLHEVRSHIEYRYNSLRSRLAIMQARLHDVGSVIKLKNPSLFLQLQRSPSDPHLIRPSSKLSKMLEKGRAGSGSNEDTESEGGRKSGSSGSSSSSNATTTTTTTTTTTSNNRDSVRKQAYAQVRTLT